MWKQCAVRLCRIVVMLFLLPGCCLAALLTTDHAENFEHTKAGVVKIIAQVDGKRKTGTGFIIRLEQDAAYILTASHVVEGDHAPLVVFYPSRNISVKTEVRKIEGGDPRGLALLAVRGKEYLPAGIQALELEPAISLNAGDEVSAIGFPRSGGSWAVSKASVNSRDGRDMILSGSLDEGSSGGPIFKNGKVAAVVTGRANSFTRAAPAALVQLTLEGWPEVAAEQDIAARPQAKEATMPAHLAKTKFAFVSDDNTLAPQVVVMNADGSSLAPLFDANKDLNAFDKRCLRNNTLLPELGHPSWSPDGSKITFEASFQIMGEGCQSSIFVSNSDGSGLRQLTKGNGDNFRPAWSPDGTKIAFSRSESKPDYASIYVMDTNGSKLTQLTSNNDGQDTRPVWSPDGNKIAFVSNHPENLAPNRAIYIINADGTNQYPITNSFPWIGGLAWSPDGKSIAFAMDKTNDEHFDIYTINLSNRNVKRLTNSRDRAYFSPTWSPDGTRIAYISGLRFNRTGYIYVMNHDGTNSFRLINKSMRINYLAWSPALKK